jgi:predicted nucleotidyltransferase
MTTLKDIKDILKNNKQRLTEKYGISLLAIFGSYSREQQSEDSDIDILVDFQKSIGIEFIDLADELEILLHHRVDLVSRKGIKPQYYQHIEKELRYV